MRRTRILAACLLALALVPGTCVRTEPPVSFNWGPFTMRPVTTQPVRMGPFVAQAAWEIVSRNFWDGGYSALVATGPGKLLAATDSGRFLAIAVEGGLPVAHGAGSVDDRPPSPGPQKKAQQDIESLARDPATGTLWAGHEYTNRIERYSDRLRFRGGVAPPGMAGWGQNSGAEAFVRLADGRFLAVEERARDGGEGRHRALLFPSDPLNGATPRPLVFIAPDGFRPVDMTPIGGGRVLVLYRGSACRGHRRSAPQSGLRASTGSVRAGKSARSCSRVSTAACRRTITRGSQ